MTEIVAILNLTPDSFSDGGKYNAPEMAETRITELQSQGAKIIDIGAESTRPGAALLSQEEEWGRLKKILPLLKKFPDITFSLDTYHPETARKSLEYGVGWINDVSGKNDPAMLEIVKNSVVKYVIMHNLGLPSDPKKTIPLNQDSIMEIIKWAEKKLSDISRFGIDLRKIIFDPGLGFGKTTEQNWEIIRHAGDFQKLSVPLMFGHSRKSFLSRGKKESPEKRQAATDSVSTRLAEKKIDYLRVHDFLATKRAIEIVEHLFAN